MASVLGPILGGFITDNLTWNWIFLFNVPAGIPVLLLIARTFPQIRPEAQKRSLDYPGMASLILAIVPILLALSWGGGQYEWGSPQTIGFLAFGLVMAVAFVVVESRSDSPIMPLDVYRNRAMAVSVVVMFLSGLALYGSIMFVPSLLPGRSGCFRNQQRPFPDAHAACGCVRGRSVRGPAPQDRTLPETGPLQHGTHDDGHDAPLALWTNGQALPGPWDPSWSWGLAWAGRCPCLPWPYKTRSRTKFRGFATSMLLFYRSVGGMMGLAVLGAVLTKQFSKRLEGMLSENVRASLSQDRLDAIAKNPRVLFDPSTTDTLRAEFAEAGADAARMTDMLLDALHSALAGAVGDALTVGAVAVSLAVVAVLFLGTPGVSEPEPERG